MLHFLSLCVCDSCCNAKEVTEVGQPRDLILWKQILHCWSLISLEKNSLTNLTQYKIYSSANNQKWRGGKAAETEVKINIAG